MKTKLTVRRFNQVMIALILIAFIVLFAIVYHGLSNLETTYQESAHVSQVQGNVQKLIASGLLFNSSSGVRFNNPNDARALTTMESALAGAENQVNRLSTLDSDLHAKYKVVMDNFLSASRVTIATSKAGSIERSHMQDNLAAWRALRFPMDEVLAELDDEAAKVKSRFENEMRSIIVGTVASVAIAAFAIVMMVLYSSQRTNSAFKTMESMLNEVAQGDGDLRKRLKDDDNTELSRMGRAFNMFTGKVQGVVEEVLISIEKLRSSVLHMSESSHHINEQIAHQHAELDQVATAMTQMTATSREVSRHASQTSDAAILANKQAREGEAITKKTLQAISGLAEEIKQAANVIHKLEQDSVEIGSVLDVIRGIAEQTNLLALNAAIEAARAGEQGRGFAVVADEVRTLASRTQASTSEIQDMIDRLQNGAQQAVNAMSNGQDKAYHMVEEASEAGLALATINESVTHISEMNLQIASAAEQQNAVAEEVNRNIAAVVQSLNEIASAAEKTVQSGKDLSDLSQHLMEVSQQFKV